MPEQYAEIEARISQACAKLHNCEKPNIAAVAREFQVPATRLRARWNGRQSRQDRSGANRRLTDDQELEVCLCLKRLDTIGTSARITVVTSCANFILGRAHATRSDTESGRRYPTIQPSTVGPRWTSGFLERHPELHIRKPERQPKKSYHPDDILNWFSRYKAICDEHGIQEGDRYNFDEMGFRVGVGQDQSIDTKRQSFLASTSNRELVTACEVISGDGTVLPPMLILSGVYHEEEWYTDTGLEDDVLVAVSDTGYANDELRLEWLRHFERYSARRQVGVYRLLLLDDYDSRYTKEFIGFCDDHKIVPFCFPPYSIHLLQPLNVVFSQPHKHSHAEAVDSATLSGCSGFNKLSLLAAITSIRRQAFKQSTIVSAFRETGLVPYSPETVLNRLQERNAEPRTPSPPPPQHSALLTTPLTLQSLKKHAEYLETTDLPYTDPRFRESVKKFVKGSLAQAQVGAIAQEELLKAKATELAPAN